MFVWSKLANSQSMELWEQRFADDPRLVIEIVKGGKSIRLRRYCDRRKDAEALCAAHGGAVAEVTREEWSRPPAPPRPVIVRDKLLVTPVTAAKELAALRQAHPRRDIISIPPEMAFGTGDHATTATCLRLLADVARERRDTTWTVADLGTGTGLLAIAARKLGSGPVFACDFDPFAVAVTGKNLVRNRVTGVTVKELDVLKWKPRGPGHAVVLANLFSTVLIEAWPVIVKTIAPGGDLIVSGILASQAWEVFTAAARCGIGFTTVVRKGKWVTARGGRMADLIAAGRDQAS